MKIYIFLVFIIMLSNKLFGNENNTFESYNFAVPESPAFKLVDANESDILRPSTVKDFGLMLSNLVSADKNGFRLSPNVSFEVAPYKILSGEKLTIKEYKENALKKILYNTRISFASKSLNDDANTNQYALGVRLSIINDADLRTNQDYAIKSEPIINDILKNQILVESILKSEMGVENFMQLNDSLKSAMISKRTKEIQSVIEKSNIIKNLKDSITKENWNAPIWDCAFACKFYNSDSIGNDLLMDNYSIWTTYGHGFGTESFQFLFGGNFNLIRNKEIEEFRLKSGIALRIYYGTNNVKGYLEGQYSNEENDKKGRYLWNLGIEFEAFNGYWVVLNFGKKSLDGFANPKKIYSINFKLTIPE